MSIRKLSYLVPALVSVGSVVSSAASELPIACEKSVAYRKGGAGAGNGGEIDETKFRLRLQKLSGFIASSEGRKVFPEVDPIHMATVAANGKLIMSDQEVRDRFGNLRTCVWDDQVCSITCDHRKHNAELEKDPTAQFVISLHEALGLLNVERGTKGNPSDTKVADRIIPYVKQVVDYDLAGGNLNPLNLGIHCYERTQMQSDRGKKKYVFVTISTEGGVQLWALSEPLGYQWYFRSQIDDPKIQAKWDRTKARMIRNGIVPKAELIASGELGSDYDKSLVYKIDAYANNSTSRFVKLNDITGSGVRVIDFGGDMKKQSLRDSRVAATLYSFKNEEAFRNTSFVYDSISETKLHCSDKARGSNALSLFEIAQEKSWLRE